MLSFGGGVALEQSEGDLMLAAKSQISDLRLVTCDGHNVTM
jgi:hypothetical protein